MTKLIDLKEAIETLDDTKLSVLPAESFQDEVEPYYGKAAYHLVKQYIKAPFMVIELNDDDENFNTFQNNYIRQYQREGVEFMLEEIMDIEIGDVLETQVRVYKVPRVEQYVLIINDEQEAMYIVTGENIFN